MTITHRNGSCAQNYHSKCFQNYYKSTEGDLLCPECVEPFEADKIAEIEKAMKDYGIADAEAARKIEEHPAKIQ